MLRAERLLEIEAILGNQGKVEVTTLCRLLSVTEMTIRRDLDDLERRGIAIRTHGGAMVPNEQILTERPYEARILRNPKEKEAIAKSALSLIKDGDRVFFDSSTTVFCLAKQLPNFKKLAVVTDTLETAIEVNNRSNIQVLCLGGELRKNTGSCVGSFTERMLDELHFTICFIGLPKVTMEGILSTSSVGQQQIKRRVIAQSEKVVLMVDGSKLGQAEFFEIEKLSKVDVLITDESMDREFLDFCTAQGIETIIAPIGE